MPRLYSSKYTVNMQYKETQMLSHLRYVCACGRAVVIGCNTKDIEIKKILSENALSGQPIWDPTVANQIQECGKMRAS